MRRTAPATREDLDSPATTIRRRQLLRRKKLLHRIYQEWYRELAGAVPEIPGGVLEIGSGAGFLREFIPNVITSEILSVPHVSVILDGCALPFRNGSLKAILLTNVLHHIAEPRRFFREAGRCVRSGGVLAMIEPWRTRWSELIYRHLHHEPFDPAATWDFPRSGPLSSANGALPWIIFERDRKVFREEFPEWTVRLIGLRMPFLYLLSGGFSRLAFQPGFTFPFWRAVENLLEREMKSWAMFALIVLNRI